MSIVIDEPNLKKECQECNQLLLMNDFIFLKTNTFNDSMSQAFKQTSIYCKQINLNPITLL